jgi:hypothetical protein
MWLGINLRSQPFCYKQVTAVYVTQPTESAAHVMHVLAVCPSSHGTGEPGDSFVRIPDQQGGLIAGNRFFALAKSAAKWRTTRARETAVRLFGKVPTTAGGDGDGLFGHFPIQPSSFSLPQKST